MRQKLQLKETLKDFMQIPGVGKRVALDLYELGFNSVKDLENQDPEKMYNDLETLQGQKVCRCMLYVFRCAVYYATEKKPKAELLKWWNWKD